jgi:Ca-activated chloride channel family protein
MAAGKAADALKAYDRALASMPDEPIAHYDRGQALYALGKFPEAQKEFQRATESSGSASGDERDPTLKADAYYNMGNSLFQQQRFKDAVDAYKHTLGLRPDDPRAKWNLELALKRMVEQKQQQQQQQQQQKSDQKQDQKQDQKEQQQSAQPDKNKQDKNESGQQNQPEQSKPPKSEEQRQPEQQTEDEKKAANQSDKAQNQDADKREKEKKKLAAAQPREIDKQDAEAVLDALERVEPTVQKDLARKRASNRRPTKDW